MSTSAIEKLYVGFFGRPASAEYLSVLVQEVQNAHGDTTVLRDIFTNEREFQVVAAQGSTALVHQVYNNLFGHDADAAGLNFWTSALDQGALAPGLLVEAVAAGAAGADAVAVRNKVIVAQAFSAVWDLRSDAPVIAPAGDPLPGQAAASLQANSPFLHAVTDDASVDQALDGLYEQVVADVAEYIALPPGRHMSIKHGGALVEQMYVGFFGRPSDRGGLEYWENALDHGGDAALLQSAFEHSAEFQAIAGLDHTQLLNRLYQNLFAHDADLGGLQYWSAALDAGSVTVGTLVGNLALAATGSDAEVLRAKIAAATAYTAATPLLGEVGSYLHTGGADYLAGVNSDAALNLALDQLYETIGGSIPIFHPVGVFGQVAA